MQVLQQILYRFHLYFLLLMPMCFYRMFFLSLLAFAIVVYIEVVEIRRGIMITWLGLLVKINYSLIKNILCSFYFVYLFIFLNIYNVYIYIYIFFLNIKLVFIYHFIINKKKSFQIKILLKIKKKIPKTYIYIYKYTLYI